MAKILVIDDEDLVRTSMRMTLEEAGHDVSEAANGKYGIKIVDQQNFDVVITDIIMPEKEGIETIIDLQQNFEDVKIIAMSGGGRTRSIDYLNIAKELGVKELLQKPFTEAELLSCVDHCLH